MDRLARTFIEQIEVTGDQLVLTIKKLYADADARRVVIRNAEGRELLSVPLTIGLAGGALTVFTAPVLAAVAAIGGTLAQVHLDIERERGPHHDPPHEDPTSR
ncbi:DUF4342 domain-containing protein [Raineyella fluvialis]|uniref:DUF4342 domain-containing protein n=1 Tax=Raineyella fluvialis TaxID=2662261 RepID=A0A5Q2FJ44_9ACTN|nr:DUF4342 domain-containing protein [Raineyella fluvialis]QGF24675.1 DUF4342 domain-containing protein [Raineyella fluvialis]